ncbi:type II secretion system F family protein [bacterium]|nr:type II secretion system F family protein [bacterium]
MPIFVYRSLAPSGAMRNSKIEALSEAHARKAIKAKGEQVLQIKEANSTQAADDNTRPTKKVPIDEVAGAIRQISILVRAGVPLVEGLNGLAEQAKSPALRACVEQVTLNVSQGMSLSDAFSQHPNVFPTLAVEMAKVAEAGGNLSEAMERLADHMESGAEISRKVKSALAYPIVVLVISIVTVILMVTFILPRFTKLFAQMNATLPWTTKMLMSVSHTCTTYWYLVIAVAAGIVYAFKRYAHSPSGKRTLDTLILKMPLIGDIVTKIVLNRVLASMSTLLASGVPMVKTLETSAAAANNEIVKEALLRSGRDVAEGTATSQALRATNTFPPLVLQMVASGEKTGELPAMLQYICTMYSRETDAKVKSLTSIIEPIMIVVLGVIVGFIAISVIVPIYSLVGGVK